MPTFNNIPIGTPNAPSICDGLSLLKSGAVRAGIAQNGKSPELFKTDVQIIAWRYNADAGYSLFFGVCGPAVGFVFNTDVTTTPSDAGHGEVTLTVHGDQMAGGFVVGANFGANANISSQRWVPYHWYAPWKGRWEDSWSYTLGFSFDLINLVIALMIFILGEKDPPATDTKIEKIDNVFNSALTSSTGMFDQKANQLISTQGKMTAEPSFTLPINLISLTKNLPPPGDALAVFNDILGKIGGGIAFGPTISLELPITLTLDSLFIDGNKYPDGSSGNTQIVYNASANTVSASGAAPISNTPKIIGANVTHTTGFTVGIGVFFYIGLLKVFSFSVNSPSLDLLALLGITVPTTTLSGQVCTDLSDGFVLDECAQVTLHLPSNVNAGSQATGTATLDHALSENFTVLLTADRAAAHLPASVTIPAGQTSASFTFTPGNDCPVTGQSPRAGTSYPVNVTGTGILPPAPTAQFMVNNQPLTVNFAQTTIHISQNPDATGTINLPFPAPAGGAQVQLQFLDFERKPTNPNAKLNDGPFPATVTVPAGQTSLPIKVTFLTGAPPNLGYGFGYYVSADGGCAFGYSESAEFVVYQQ